MIRYLCNRYITMTRSYVRCRHRGLLDRSRSATEYSRLYASIQGTEEEEVSWCESAREELCRSIMDRRRYGRKPFSLAKGRPLSLSELLALESR